MNHTDLLLLSCQATELNLKKLIHLARPVAWVAIRTSLILNLPNQTRPHVTSLFYNLIPNHNKERKNESRKSLVKAAEKQQNFRSGAG